MRTDPRRRFADRGYAGSTGSIRSLLFTDRMAVTMNSSVITPRAVLVIALIFLALGVAIGLQWNEEIKHRAAMRKATSVPCIEAPRILARAG